MSTAVMMINSPLNGPSLCQRTNFFRIKTSSHFLMTNKHFSQIVLLLLFKLCYGYRHISRDANTIICTSLCKSQIYQDVSTQFGKSTTK